MFTGASPVLQCLFRSGVKREDTSPSASAAASASAASPTSAAPSAAATSATDGPAAAAARSYKKKGTAATAMKAPAPRALKANASPKANAVPLPFSADKARYNRFNYKLRVAPPAWRQ